MGSIILKSRLYCAYFLLFLSTLFTIACYIFNFSFLDIGFTLIISIFLYLYLNSINRQLDTSIHLSLTNTHVLILNIVFLFVLCLHMFVLHVYNSTILHYILIIFLSLLVVVEIISLPYNNTVDVGVSIFKILIISVLLRWYIYFQTPTYVGTDPWYHSTIISEILKFGYLPINYSYTKYPIIHILISMGSIITSINIKNSMILTVGIFEIVSLMYIQLVGNFVSSKRNGLLATLLVGVSGYHISWGYYIIPMSLGLGFFTLIFYLSVKKGLLGSFTKNHAQETCNLIQSNTASLSFLSDLIKNSHSLPKKETSQKLLFTLLVLLIVFLIILTHTISTTITLLFISISYFTSLIYQRFVKNDVDTSFSSLSLVLIMFTSSIGYWMYTSGFLGYIILSIKSAFMISEIDPVVASPILVSSIERQLNRIELLSFLGFTIIGSMFWILNENLKYIKLVLVVTGAIIISIMFTCIFIGIDSILPDRWYAFLYVIIANIASVGIFYLASSFEKRSFKIFSLLIIVSLFTLFAITGSAANTGSAYYAQEKIRNSLTESEFISFNTLSTIHNKNVYSDGYSNNYFRYVTESKTVDISSNIGVFNDKDGLLVLRVPYLMGSLIQVPILDNKEVGYSSTYSEFNLDLYILNNDNISKIYDSFDVQGYIKCRG